MKYLLIPLFGMLVLFACNNNTKPETNKPDSTVVVKRDTAEKLGYYTVAGDSLVIPPFDITLDLSPKANAELKSTKETIIVAAFFSGIPKDKNAPDIGEDGEYYMAHKDIELKDDRIAYFRDIKISRTRYDSLENKDIQLLINVYSGRRASENNILDCEILSDSMSHAQNGHFTLKGKLIRE